MKASLGPALVTEASKAVFDCFAEVPFCKVEPVRAKKAAADSRVSCVAQLRTQNKKFTLLIEVKRSGQPRFVRGAVNQLKRYEAEFSNPYGIFVAPFITEEAGGILAAENLGYIDLAGNCRISIGGIYIRKEGRENPFTEKRDLRSLYSRKGERVVRTLLLDKRAWKVGQLAKEAKVSLGQASNIKKLLEAREWLTSDSDGIRLLQPEKLLSEWASAYQFRRHRIVEYYSPDSLAAIEERLAAKRGKKSLGVLTAFSGAARSAPVVRYKRAMAFVRSSCEAVAKELEWNSVSSGGNVILIEPYDEGVFYGSREIDGLQITSPVQTYLDLRAAAGRGEEAADALLREVLRPSW